jgi:hypothetical protein
MVAKLVMGAFDVRQCMKREAKPISDIRKVDYAYYKPVSEAAKGKNQRSKANI